MQNTQHTPGPWRWEFNAKSKKVQLCGGSNPFDLTVMDFTRWGMSGAAPRFRDNSDHGLLTHCNQWSVSVEGRIHHADWFRDIDHPDARLIASAPELLEALKSVVESATPNARDNPSMSLAWQKARAAIAKATANKLIP